MYQISQLGNLRLKIDNQQEVDYVFKGNDGQIHIVYKQKCPLLQMEGEIGKSTIMEEIMIDLEENDDKNGDFTQLLQIAHDYIRCVDCGPNLYNERCFEFTGEIKAREVLEFEIYAKICKKFRDYGINYYNPCNIRSAEIVIKYQERIATLIDDLVNKVCGDCYCF